MKVEISRERMTRLGELAFEVFSRARATRKLTLNSLVEENVIPNRQKIYAV